LLCCFVSYAALNFFPFPASSCLAGRPAGRGLSSLCRSQFSSWFRPHDLSDWLSVRAFFSSSSLAEFSSSVMKNQLFARLSIFPVPLSPCPAHGFYPPTWTVGRNFSCSFLRLLNSRFPFPLFLHRQPDGLSFTAYIDLFRRVLLLPPLIRLLMVVMFLSLLVCCACNQLFLSAPPFLSRFSRSFFEHSILTKSSEICRTRSIPAGGGK